MKISYISDLHLDFHVPFHKNQDKWKSRTVDFIENIIPTDINREDILIIAGDISHFNKQSFWTLDTFAKHYKKVYFVTGNHDHYLISTNQKCKYKNNSTNRVNELIEMVKQLPNVIYLDNFEKHNIDNNITIAGSTFWYPLENFNQESFFHLNSNDSRLISGLDIKNKHREQLQQYRELDEATILVTHVPIITINSHIKYNSTACYLTPVDEIKTKYHIFGHCHEQNVYEKVYGNFYINAVGYPDEKLPIEIKSFEIKI